MTKRLISFSLIFCLVCTFFLTPKVSAEELVGTTSADSQGIGDYSITLPNSPDQKYNVKFAISRKLLNEENYAPNSEVYYIEVVDANGNKNEEKSSYYKFNNQWNNDHGHPETNVTITDIPAGSTATVKYISVEKIEYDAWGTAIWSNYKKTYMCMMVTNANSESEEIVLIDDENTHKQLVVGETISQTASVAKEEDKSFTRVTEDTLLDISGHTDYAGLDFLTYLLSAYNVVSLDEIHSTHIVGPIISQNIAQRTYQEGIEVGYLAASDYSGGVSSYVGIFTSYGDNQIGVRFNYDFDTKQNSNFEFPFAYSKLTGLYLELKGDVNHLVEHYILEDGSEPVSANHTGLTETYQNDNFIDFTALATALNHSSLDILNSGNAEDYDESVKFEFDTTDGTIANASIKITVLNEEPIEITATNGETYIDSDGNVRGFSDFVSEAERSLHGDNGYRLTINTQESWTIKTADKLHEVNMLLPDDYDYYERPYLMPTTINFDCEYINPKVYSIDTNDDGITEEIKHSRMPYTLIEGKEFDTKLGENGEYGEVGNKIIWNMPYVATGKNGENDNRLSLLYGSHNIAGHIIAPKAEFWNYEENGAWAGGNLNGTAIVKSFYSGTMEMHKWAYTGLAEKVVLYSVKALKTINGTEKPKNREYTFILDVIRDENGNIPSGVVNNVFPMQENSSLKDGEEGLVKFSSLAFNKDGTYSFILYEDASMDTPTDNIEYDLTKYQVDITVSSTQTEELTTYYIQDVKKYKIENEKGEVLEPRVEIEDEPNKTEFVFNNKIKSEETINLHFIKKSASGPVLPGAKFYVSEMISKDDITKPEGGYFDKFTTDEHGNLNITNLKKSTFYKLWEYEAPSGHVLGKGYWILEIGSNGFLLSITPMDGANDIEDKKVIYNELEQENDLDITLTKKNQMNTLLSGVDFRLQRVVINEQGVPEVVKNAYDVTTETNMNGQLNFTNLEGNHIYMLTETSTPLGHYEHTGYWLIDVIGDKTHPSAPLTYSIVEYDRDHNKVRDIENNILYNEKEEFKLPTTGGGGKELFYCLGISLMITAFLFLKKKSLNNIK